ncbi:MAG: hypothetical protein EA378_09390 [Phycisphaerales bacterium]|nr:MAG: hypothetical protein EA378_09390 [Phycisphaerales bacterium]
MNATTTPLAEAIGRFERAGEGESVVQLIETEPSPRALLDFGDLTFRETELLPAGATDTDRARILRRRLADHTGAHSSADDLLRIDLSSPEPEGDDPERPTLSRGSPLLAELRAVEEGNGNGGAVSDALRVRLSQGFSIVGSGGNQSIDDEYSYFALSAGAAFQLNQRAGLEVGYDFYRRTSPSELRAIEIEDEGIFARLQFRF